MAFEDRCCSPSPPPGIPHSPQNGSSFTTDQERSMSVSSMENGERTSPSMLRVSVKEEHHVADEHVLGNQQTSTPITFSITNILSNNFGSKIASRKIQHERKSSLFRPYDVEERRNEARCASRQRSDDGVDDDEEDEEIVVADPEPMPKFTNGAIDFSSNATRNGVHSQQPLQHHHHPLMPHSLHPNAPLYSNFYSHAQYPTLANNIYPRLHEEILNSQKKYQQYYQTTQLLSDSVLSNYPPLGNLCKTVSQIGQSTPVGAVTPINNKITSPMAALTATQKKFNGRESVESTSTNASQSNTNTSGSNGGSAGASKDQNSATTKTPQSNSLDSGMESSDDTKSESGSTKEESGSQLWPAWIYCTRYSDRPSSGNVSPHEFVNIYLHSTMASTNGSHNWRLLLDIRLKVCLCEWDVH